MSTPKKLIELIALAGQHAHTVLIDRGLRSLMPCWLLDDADGLQIIGTPWADDAEKELAAKMLRAHMRKAKTRAYSFVTEAWTATQQGPYKPGEDKRPAERPDRQEVVIALATDGRDTEWRKWAIKRDWEERVTALEPLPMDYVGISSWMTDLLKP